MPDVPVTRRSAVVDQPAQAAEEGAESPEPQAGPQLDVTVVGWVQDGSRVSIANAELELVQLVNGLPYGPTVYLRSSSDGTFETVIRIHHWEPGWRRAELEMKAWSPGFQLSIKESWVLPGSPRVELKMTLWRGGVVSGRVVDQRSDPVAGATVVLNSDGEMVNMEDTREDGTFTINFEQAGEHVLLARREGGGVSDPLPVRLHIEQRNTAQDLILTEGAGQIGGVLVDSFAEPVPGHGLTVMSESYLASRGLSIDDHEIPSGWSDSDFSGLEEHGLVHSQVTTSADGSFRFTGLTPGKFAIVSWHADRRVWVARTGELNLRLVREVYTLHVRVQDEEDPEQPMHGVVVSRRSDGVQSYWKLSGSEVQFPVRPRETYIVSYMTPSPLWYGTGSIEGLSPDRTPQMGRVERRIWIDPGDPKHSLLLPVRSQAVGVLEVRCRLPSGLAESSLGGEIVAGQEGSRWRSFHLGSSSVERIALAAGKYVLVLEDELNAPGLSGWIRSFEAAPAARSAFPSTFTATVPALDRQGVNVLPGETTEVTVEMVEAGAVLIILGSEGEAVPALKASVLKYPQGENRSDAASSYFISWDERRPVSGYLLRWSLGAGEYAWHASADGYRDLELDFTVTPGELTVVRGTWRE